MDHTAWLVLQKRLAQRESWFNIDSGRRTETRMNTINVSARDAGRIER